MEHEQKTVYCGHDHGLFGLPLLQVCQQVDRDGISLEESPAQQRHQAQEQKDCPAKDQTDMPEAHWGALLKLRVGWKDHELDISSEDHDKNCRDQVMVHLDSHKTLSGV